MDKLMSNVVVFAALASTVLLHCATAQTVHVVGDSLGWRIPPQNNASAYTTWASGKNFNVGDVLVFNFPNGRHDVLQVQENSYDACTSANAIGEIITTGPANVTLDSAGDHYYICTLEGHCEAGQKLAITVSGTPGAGAIPPASRPSGSPTRPGNSPPDSSTTAAFASFILVLLSIAMSLFV